ncbi:MAG TPA: Hsp20/alpha crystallin family protein [Pyrinomonadaceae bacterium]|jgi:HSP20 family protein|nr:Hsp20/alpha crystallin family protein [Pyrinomonadaceae bacterium]
MNQSLRCSKMAHGWDPIRDLVMLQDRMNRLFEDATQRRGARDSGEGESEQEIEGTDWTPAADVYEKENAYVVALDLPGIERETLDISLDQDRLSIRGSRTIEEGDERRTERPRGRFLRRFGLPSTIDQQGIAADYKDGVLRVTLPKRKAKQAQRVEIKVQ